MEIFRKIILGLSCAAFAVCCLFLNLMGGIGLMSNNYTDIGRALIISVVLLGLSLLLAFFRNWITNLGSALLNIAGTVFYIYPISVLNGIPNATVPKESVEVLTSRIYPAIIVTVLLAIAVFADIFSYERSVKRAERKNAKLKEKNRSLKEDEKIV
jgi:hypothetical protein